VISFLDAFSGSREDGRDVLGEAMSIQEELGDRRGLAYSAFTLRWGRSAAPEMVNRAVELGRETGDGQITAWGLLVLGSRTEDLLGTRPLHEEALDIARACGERWSEAMALNNLGEISYYEGDFANGAVMIQRASEIFREIGDVYGLREVLRNQCVIALLGGDDDRVESILSEARDRFAGTDAARYLVQLYRVAIRASLERGDADRARLLVHEARSLATDPLLGWYVTESEGLLALATGDADRLHEIAMEPERARAGVGTSESLLGPLYQLEAEFMLAYGEPGEAVAAAKKALRWSLGQSPWRAADALEVLGRIAAGEEPARALGFFGAADAGRARYGGRRLAALTPAVTDAIDSARRALAPEAADEASERGAHAPLGSYLD
jgi:tetratricopeptide (TPR) repeat protein